MFHNPEQSNSANRHGGSRVFQDKLLPCFGSSYYRAQAQRILQTLDTALEQHLIPIESAQAIRAIFEDVRGNERRFDLLCLAGELCKLDKTRRNEAFAAVTAFAKQAEQFPTKLVNQVISQLIYISESSYPEVLSNGIACLAQIKNASVAQRFCSSASFDFSLPKAEFQNGEVAGQLLQLAVLRLSIVHDLNRKSIARLYRVMFEHLPRQEGYKARLHILLSGQPYQTIRQNLKAVRDMESLECKPNSSHQMRLLLQSAALPEYLAVLQKLPDNMARDAAINLFVQFEQAGSGSHQLLTPMLVEWSQHNTPDQILLKALRLADQKVPIRLVLAYALVFDSLSEIKDLVLESKNENAFQRILDAVKSFTDRVAAFQPHRHFASIKFVIEKLAGVKSLVLFEKLSFEKLLLCLNARGLADEHTIRSIEEFEEFFTELKAQLAISEILHSPPYVSQDLREEFMLSNNFGGDNPPFSLETTAADTQILFQRQVDETFLRVEDPHFGFWSDTYNFRHTPISRHCLFDEVAAGDLQASLYVIPASDVSKFPGRGRLITDIRSEHIFRTLDTAPWSEVFGKYQDLLNIFGDSVSFDPIDNLSAGQVVHLRGFEVYSFPDNDFFSIADEHLSLIIWNQHFDPCSAQAISLVPTRVMDSFLLRLAIPYHPAFDQFPLEDIRDVTIEPPSLKGIKRRCHELDTAVGLINPTSGSCFSGGFCNGFQIGSQPFHDWENSKKQWRDGFGHPHKFNIKDEWQTLNRLKIAHQRVYEITAALLNFRDVYKMLLGLAARDHFSNKKIEVAVGGRVLNHFCKFHSEYSQLNQRKHAPVLVLAPMHKSAPELDSPIVLDGTTGFGFSQWQRPFELNMLDGTISAEVADFWRMYVDPWLSERENFWVAPRLVARENAEDLIELYMKKS